RGKNNQVDTLAQFFADRAEMKVLHMVTSSPARTPSLTMFGNPDYFFQTTRGSLPLTPQNCGANPALCVAQGLGFAWNHGDVQQAIVRTWFCMVGPGVRRQGRDDRLFSDHTDLRPTALALVGLKDDHVHDGRVLIEKLEGRDDGNNDFLELARVYKQLNAPLGSVGQTSLMLATTAIKGPDTTYAWYLSQIGPLTAERDQLAGEIKLALNAAEFGGGSSRDLHANGLIARAKALIDRFSDLAERAGH